MPIWLNILIILVLWIVIIVIRQLIKERNYCICGHKERIHHRHYYFNIDKPSKTRRETAECTVQDCNCKKFNKDLNRGSQVKHGI